MSDFMRWMYDHYIKPNIENQPRNLGEIMQIDLLNNELDPEMRQNLQEVLALYAVYGFRLGLRTGMTLENELM